MTHRTRNLPTIGLAGIALALAVGLGLVARPWGSAGEPMGSADPRATSDAASSSEEPELLSRQDLGDLEPRAAANSDRPAADPGTPDPGTEGWISVRSSSGLPLRVLSVPSASDPDEIRRTWEPHWGSFLVDPDRAGLHVSAPAHRPTSLHLPVTVLEPVSLLTLSCSDRVQPLEPLWDLAGLTGWTEDLWVDLSWGLVDGSWQLAYSGSGLARAHPRLTGIPFHLELASGWSLDGEVHPLDDVRAEVVLDPRLAEADLRTTLTLELPETAPTNVWWVRVQSTRWDPERGVYGPPPESFHREGPWGHLTATADWNRPDPGFTMLSGELADVVAIEGRRYSVTARSHRGDWVVRRTDRVDGAGHWILEPVHVPPLRLRLLDEDEGRGVPEVSVHATLRPHAGQGSGLDPAWILDGSGRVGPGGDWSMSLIPVAVPAPPTPLPHGRARLTLEVEGYETSGLELDLDLDRGTEERPLEVHLRRGEPDLVATNLDDVSAFEWERGELVWDSSGAIQKVGDVRLFRRADAVGSGGASLELRFPPGSPAAEQFRRDAREGRVDHALLWTGDQRVLGLEHRRDGWRVAPAAEHTLVFLGFHPAPADVTHTVRLHWAGIDVPFGVVPPELDRDDVRVVVPRDGVELSIGRVDGIDPAPTPRTSPPTTGPWELHAPAD